MDNTIIQSFVAGGSSGAIVGLFYIIYKIFRHSSCRSKCCGIKSSLSVDLEKGLTSDISEKNSFNK